MLGLKIDKADPQPNISCNSPQLPRATMRVISKHVQINQNAIDKKESNQTGAGFLKLNHDPNGQMYEGFVFVFLPKEF